MLSVKSDFYRTHGWGRRLWDVFTGVSTSSRRHFRRRHLVFKMAASEMTSTRTWGEFFDPYWGGGAKWRPFRFRRPSWMTSFAEPEMRSSKMAAGSGRAAILHLPLNGGRKTRPILLWTQLDLMGETSFRGNISGLGYQQHIIYHTIALAYLQIIWLLVVSNMFLMSILNFQSSWIHVLSIRKNWQIMIC